MHVVTAMSMLISLGWAAEARAQKARAGKAPPAMTASPSKPSWKAIFRVVPNPLPPVSGFRFAISGLTSNGIKAIKAFEVQTHLTAAAVGVRDYAKTKTTPVFSDVFVTLNESSAADWIAWYNDFVISGNSTASNERTFTLDLMSASSGAPIASVKAYGVGIVSLRANPAAHGTLIAELYAKRMEFVTTASSK